LKKYKLTLTAQAEAVLRRMAARDEGLYQRVSNVLDSLETDPYQGKSLKGPLDHFYSYRVGSYRVIYRIFRDKLLVVVIDIGHRRDIYR
jgi:mRNA interferase RelE/StbE